MQITVGKIVAVLIALGTCAIRFAYHGTITINDATGALALLLPLALIWFPGELGSITGNFSRGGHIDVRTPAFLVAMRAWL